MTSAIQFNNEFSHLAESRKSEFHETDENLNHLSNEKVKKESEIEINDGNKTKKLSAAMESMRNFIRSNVIPPNTNELSVTSSNINEVDRIRRISDSQEGCSLDSRKENRSNKKKKSKFVKYGKGRKQRPLAIQNEGASLWTPKEGCCWKSVAGRTVRLEDIPVNKLCEAEREALQQFVLRLLDEYNFCHITMPKEKRVSPSWRWKSLIPLIKGYKGIPEEKAAIPEKMVFSVDLYQVIENDKAAEKAEEINEAKSFDESKSEEQEETLVKDLSRKRNSDPSIHTYSRTVEDDLDVDDYLRTYPNIRREENYMKNHRKSRLIEALSLSSTSASSVCVLDKEAEFKPPDQQVPKIIRDTVNFMNKHALKTMYIFRNEGSKKRVKQMREEYDKGQRDVITDDSHPPDVAALFKDFLRNLPEPLLTRELYGAFIALGNINDMELYNRFLKYLIWLLPVANRDTLQVMLECLKNVADNSHEHYNDDGNLVPGNRMDAGNIAIVMAPNVLYRVKGYKANNTSQMEEETQTTIDILESLILLHKELFVIEREIHDEILKILLETDPETVDYVLRKKSTRTSLVDVLRSFEDNAKLEDRRSSSVRLRKLSRDEKEVHKTQSFNSGTSNKPIKRRHLSTVTRPDLNKLLSPEKPGISKFSRNLLRMSLGSRELRSKTSPLSSPRSSFRRKKNSSHSSIQDAREVVNEEGFSFSKKTNGMTNTLSVSDVAIESKKSFTERQEDEDSIYRQSNLSRDKARKLSASKDRRRKISLPTFLHGSGDRTLLKAPSQTSSIDGIKVSLSSTSDFGVIRKISEGEDADKNGDKNDCIKTESALESVKCLEVEDSRAELRNDSIVGNFNDYQKGDILDWQISLPESIPPDFASVETRL